MKIIHLYKHRICPADEDKKIKYCHLKRFKFLCILLLSIQSFSFAQNNPAWISGRTTGKLPQLSYSLGYDRLGSAMMGYLDSDVLLKITDSIGPHYKVQLSTNHNVYIEKDNVKPDKRRNSFNKNFLLNNWIANGGNDGYDTLKFFLDEKLPYKSRMEIKPSKIILTLYGVQSNTNFIMQHIATLKEIENVDFDQTEDDVVEISIYLKHAQHWGYTLYYQDDALVLLVKQAPEKMSLQNFKIAIDAGHGGTNTGSRGNNTGIKEKDYTLIFAKKLAQVLVDSGAQVVMTRIADDSFDNTDRVLFLQQQKPDLLISLHLNSADNRAAQGTGTFYKYLGFRNLSTFILQQIFYATQREPYGNIGNFNFILNAPTDFPNALVEIAFLSNKVEERKIMEVDFQNKIVSGIVNGIRAFIQNGITLNP